MVSVEWFSIDLHGICTTVFSHDNDVSILTRVIRAPRAGFARVAPVRTDRHNRKRQAGRNPDRNLGGKHRRRLEAVFNGQFFRRARNNAGRGQGFRSENDNGGN